MESDYLAASTPPPALPPDLTREVQTALQRLWTTAQPEGSGPHHRRVAVGEPRGQRKSMMPTAFDLMMLGSVAFVIACALTVLAGVVLLEHVLPVSTPTNDAAPSLVMFEAQEAWARLFAQTEALGIHPIVALARQLAPLVPAREDEALGEFAFLFEQPAITSDEDGAAIPSLPQRMDDAELITETPAYA